MASFSDEPWESPESDLDASAFCAVCLIDLNEGRDKIKSKCYLPIRKRPGGAVNKAALRNAAARLFVLKGVPAEEKRKAARSLVRLMRQAKIEIGSEALLRLAGER